MTTPKYHSRTIDDTVQGREEEVLRERRKNKKREGICKIFVDPKQTYYRYFIKITLRLTLLSI